MKRSMQVALLLCGLALTYVSAAAAGPAVDGGHICPFKLCPRNPPSSR